MKELLKLKLFWLNDLCIAGAACLALKCNVVKMWGPGGRTGEVEIGQRP